MRRGAGVHADDLGHLRALRSRAGAHLKRRARRYAAVGHYAPPRLHAKSEPLGTRIGNAIAACVIWLACFAVVMSIEVFVFGGVIVDDGSTFGHLIPWKMIKEIFGG